MPIQWWMFAGIWYFLTLETVQTKPMDMVRPPDVQWQAVVYSGSGQCFAHEAPLITAWGDLSVN